MTKTYRGIEFVNALVSGELRAPIVKEGLVKPTEKGEDYDQSAILFAEGASCAAWIEVPLAMIDYVEYLATVGCKDHEHPLVRLHLKQPPQENQIARVLAEFLRSSESPRYSNPIIAQERCQYFRGPCKRNEDGTYTRYIRYVDCSDKEEPCNPSPAPFLGYLSLRVEPQQDRVYLWATGRGFTPGGTVDFYADDLPNRTAPLALGSTVADGGGNVTDFFFQLKHCGFPVDRGGTIRAVDRATRGWAVTQNPIYYCG